MSRIDANRDIYETWPIETKQAVLDGKAEPGMLPEMVLVAWGKPTEIVASPGGGPGDEIWVYKRGGVDDSAMMGMPNPSYPAGGTYPGGTYPGSGYPSAGYPSTGGGSVIGVSTGRGGTGIFTGGNTGIGIGGGMGIGSAVYSLVKLAGWLDEPALLDTAMEMVVSIDDEIIANDAKMDLMFGAAGAILGLLALWEARPDPRVLERAQACGRHLLAKRETTPTGHLAWRASPGGPFLTGVSHGAAGFAHALFQLAEASGDEIYRTAAREAVAYEDAMFRPLAKNWPDFRSSPDHSPSAPCWCSWCHGAPGIGLARLAEPAGGSQTARDIAAAVETTAQHGITDIDHLCCGNLGRADLLLEAGESLNRPELIEEARTLASEVVVRARQNGGYRLGNSSAYSLSLFQGSAGIGYELLRLACPKELPTVLLWR